MDRLLTLHIFLTDKIGETTEQYSWLSYILASEQGETSTAILYFGIPAFWLLAGCSDYIGQR